MIANELEEGPITMQALGQSDLSDSLLGALDSPRVPDAAIAQLVGQGPSFGQRMAQAAAGGVAFMRGQSNPVTPILAGQQQERVSLATMLQKMNAQADLKDYRNAGLQLKKQELLDKRADKQQALLKGAVDLSMSILNNPNAPDSAVVMAQDNLRNFAPKLYPGYQVPESIIQRNTTKADLEAFMQDAFLNATVQAGPDGNNRYLLEPEAAAFVSKRHPRIPVNEIPQLADTLNRPDVQKLYGLQTNEERKRQAVQDEINELRLAEKMLPPEWRGAPANVRQLSAIAQDKFPGVSLSELTAEQKREVSAAFDLTQRETKRDQYEFQNDLNFNRQLALLEARGEQQQALQWDRLNKTTQPKPPTQRELMTVRDKFGKNANAIRALQGLRTDLAKIPADALPDGEDMISMGIASVRRKVLYPGQEANFAVHQRYFEVIKGLVERGYLDAKATQSVRTDLAQLEAMNNMPPRATMDKYLKRTQQMIRDSMKFELESMEASPGTSPELIETAKSIVGRVMPKEQSVQPEPRVNPLVRRLKVKNLKTGKTEWATMNVGDAIPPGYIEVTK